MRSLLATAVLFVCLSFTIGNAAAGERDCADASQAVPISANGSVLVAGTECQGLYRVSLRAGDTLRLTSPDNAEIDGHVLMAFEGDTLARQACSDNYNEWSIHGGQSYLDCPIPATGSYYIALSFGAGYHLGLTTTHAAPGVSTRPGSCATGSAPLLPIGVTQIGAGMLCPAGRQYFRVKLKRGQHVVFEWTTLTHTPTDAPSRFNSGVYPPATTIFTIGNAHTCGDSTYSGSGGQIPIEICNVPRTGSYLIAFGYTTTQLHIRLKG